MSKPIRGWAAILFFSFQPKITNLVEAVEISLPVKFSWILFGDFRGEVKNVSAYQRPGRPSDPHPQKKKLVEDVAILFLSSLIALRSAVLEEKSKMFQPIRGQGAILLFRSVRKTQTWKVERTLSSCFTWVSLNSIKRYQRRSPKCLGQLEPRVAILFLRSARTTQIW